MRKFETGATRDTDDNKYDYEAFLSPRVLESFAAYMHKNRFQADGTKRDGDNWQKGIPLDAYMKSMFRHFMDIWKAHRGLQAPDIKESLNALLFNAMGMLHEKLKTTKLSQEAWDKIVAELSEPPTLHVENGDFDDPRHLQNEWDENIQHAYTHRYGELAHDEEAIKEEKDCCEECCAECDNSCSYTSTGTVARMERSEVLGVHEKRTEENVPPLAPEVQSAIGREKAP